MYSVNALALIQDVAPGWIYDKIRTKKLKAVKTGGRYMISQAEVARHPEVFWGVRRSGTTDVCPRCGRQFEKRSPSHKYCDHNCQTSSKRNRFMIFRRDSFRCVYCGRTSFADGILLATDHVVPKSIGGSHEAANLVTACKECNSAKRDRRLSNESDILAEVARRNKVAGIAGTLVVWFP